MSRYSLKDLEYWSDRIEKVAEELGIDHYPQEFEIIDYLTMQERVAYLGMLSYYPTWSSGKRYELGSTLYRTGLQYLPYELVTHTNPCLACLMDLNDLAMQILTISHVYGHNNFFKNNVYFKQGLKPEKVRDFFHSSAEKIRSYENDPLIGPSAVRKCIDAAQGLQWQCLNAQNLGAGNEDDSLLAFLRDNSPRQLANWEKYIINTVITTFNYLIKPNMITIGMNEGWATYCHYKIINALKLNEKLRGAFARHHSKVVRLPDSPTAFNHYLVNFEIWNKIEKKFQLEDDTPKNFSALKPIPPQLFEIMSQYNDASFLDKYLDEELARELGLLIFDRVGQNTVATRVINGTNSAEEENQSFRLIKGQLIENLGFNQVPIVRVSDPNHAGHGYLYLKHEFDGRHLQSDFASHTLEHIYYFWQKQVLLETKTYNRHLPYIYQYNGTQHFSFRKR